MTTEKIEGTARTTASRTSTLSLIGQALGRYGIVLAFLVLCLVLSFLSPYFLTTQNILNVLLQASINLVVSVGMTFVITSGGIDLSVGSIVAVAGMVMADVVARKWGIWVAVPLALLVGTLCGWFNGTLITRLRLPPFIVTLGTMSILRGVALIYNDGKPLYGLAQKELKVISGDIASIPIPVIIALAVALLAHFVLRHTTIGEYTTAIGGNEETARLSGIDVRRYKVIIYSISGLMCGLAGVILTARLSAAEPIAGTMYELDAIAATVMGGTSLSGGEGTIFGTIIGALLMGVLRNGLNLLNIQSYYQQLVIGSVIVLAVAVDKLRKR
ncbi:MAG: sugar ABC transporter permease [Chloroflexota bacterium]|nr:MAG: sugar ABC transporter permease [Chloroflexota bacterium]